MDEQGSPSVERDPPRNLRVETGGGGNCGRLLKAIFSGDGPDRTTEYGY